MESALLWFCPVWYVSAYFYLVRLWTPSRSVACESWRPEGRCLQGSIRVTGLSHTATPFPDIGSMPSCSMRPAKPGSSVTKDGGCSISSERGEVLQGSLPIPRGGHDPSPPPCRSG